MNNYILKPVKSKDFNFICFSLNESRPDDYWEFLEKELSSIHSEAVVLLDLYKANGSNSRRFFKISFDGNKLHLKDIKKINKENIEEKIFNDCQYFYATH